MASAASVGAAVAAVTHSAVRHQQHATTGTPVLRLLLYELTLTDAHTT